MVHRRVVDSSLVLPVLQDRLYLGTEEKDSAHERVVQGLLAEPIPSEEESPLPRIPKGESEHSPELSEARRAPLFVRVHHRLRVRFCVELVALPLELVFQLAIVVDLAVEHDPNRIVLVMNWLATSGDVDYAQPVD